MVKSNCVQCSRRFTAPTKRKKYCSDLCRITASKARRKAEAAGLPIPIKKFTKHGENKSKPKSKPEEDVKVVAINPRGEEPPIPKKSDVGDVERAVARQVEEAGMHEHPMGLAAIVLGRRLDRSAGESGASISRMVQQLENVLKTVMQGAGKESDPISELKSMRDRKRNAAG